jgi:hypothetical protein
VLAEKQISREQALAQIGMLQCIMHDLEQAPEHLVSSAELGYRQSF